MKLMKKAVKTAFFTFLILSFAVLGAAVFLQIKLPDTYKVTKGEDLKINTVLPVTAVADGSGENYSATLKLFGVIPYSTVNVEVVDESYVAVLGQPFGMKIYTDGVLVVDSSDIDTASGKQNPALKAGIKVGDYISSVNGTAITTNEQLAEIVENSGGAKLNVRAVRNGKSFVTHIRPLKDAKSGIYKIGIWVRDSSAGIGTLTFYSPSTKTICGLGHAICDSDTDEILSVSAGQMVNAEIVSVQKGKEGTPGELKGRFKGDVLANIDLNCECGVYGKTSENIYTATLTQIAHNQEVENGEAQILCTVNGSKPKLYSCTVRRHNTSVFGGEQNLTVTVTDETLLNETGGIVQGMSGSPILQNGKLIGAVTHVLVDDPTTGYAIFAENMLETAQSVANENKLKDAS